MNVLIIGDDLGMRESLELLTEAEGHVARSVMDAPAATAALGERYWDVVLLDQNLRGPTAGPTGLDLIEAARATSPGALIIVLTAYADPTHTQRAFDLGVDDYLEKGRHMQALLRAKLRVAHRLAHARRWAALWGPPLEAEIQRAWTELQTEEDRHRKGQLLEDLLTGLFRSVPGLEGVHPDVRNDIEQIDLVIANEADGVLGKQGSYLLVECKNWSSTVGRPELDAFVGKMRRRRGAVTAGYFAAWNGVTAPFEEARRQEPEFTIVVLDRGALGALVGSSDRKAGLEEAFRRACFDQT